MLPLDFDTPTTDDRSVSRGFEIGLVLLAAAFAYSLSFKLPFYPAFHESDHLIFMYEGWRMFNGEWIYRDFFEFTFPGTQTLYYLLFSVFGPVYWVSAALVVAIAALSCWVLVRVSREVIPSALSYVPALIFIFFGFRWFGVDPSHRMLSPFLLMSAVLVILRGTGIRNLVTAGSLCALASFFTQQRGVAAVAAITVFLLLESKSTGIGLRYAIGRIGALLGAFIGMLTLLCLPFIAAAGPTQFFESTVEYTLLYYSQGPPNQIGIYLADLEKAFANASATGLFALLPTLFFAAILPVGAIIISGAILVKRDKWATNRPAALLALVSLFSLVTTPAPNQGRLYQISMPMLVLAVWWLDRQISSVAVRARLASGIAIVVIGLSLLQAVRFQTNWNFVFWPTPTGTLAVVPSEHFERYRWVSERTSPGDAFYEAAQPFIYFPLQLRNPTRYGQIWPSGYTPRTHVTETVADLKRQPPRFILWRNDYNKPEAERSPGDSTGPLAEFLQTHYKPTGPVYNVDSNPTQVWALKGAEQIQK